MKLSFIYHLCSERLATQAYGPVMHVNSMYVGQLFNNILSVVNRQRYVKVLPVLTQFACK